MRLPAATRGFCMHAWASQSVSSPRVDVCISFCSKLKNISWQPWQMPQSFITGQLPHKLWPYVFFYLYILFYVFFFIYIYYTMYFFNYKYYYMYLCIKKFLKKAWYPFNFFFIKFWIFSFRKFLFIKTNVLEHAGSFDIHIEKFKKTKIHFLHKTAPQLLGVFFLGLYPPPPSQLSSVALEDLEVLISISYNLCLL